MDVYHNLQAHYEGFLKTSFLWKNEESQNLLQLELPQIPTSIFSEPIQKKMRLGKIVERFASHYFSKVPNLNILEENIPIQRDKLTLGELDCLLELEGQPLHVEIAYKFYLFDDTHGASEESHWIGPNRKDNLSKKLSKLSLKQLPLLFSSECAPTLQSHKLKADQFKQRVYFKAQLFVPYPLLNSSFNKVNDACVSGFYMNMSTLEQFRTFKFYMPKKIDWLLVTDSQVNWQTYHQILPLITKNIASQNSVMYWLKNPNGEMQKCFIVWW